MTGPSCEDERMPLTHGLSAEAIIIVDKSSRTNRSHRREHAAALGKYRACYSKATVWERRGKQSWLCKNN